MGVPLEPDAVRFRFRSRETGISSRFIEIFGNNENPLSSDTSRIANQLCSADLRPTIGPSRSTNSPAA